MNCSEIYNAQCSITVLENTLECIFGVVNMEKESKMCFNPMCKMPVGNKNLTELKPPHGFQS